MTSEGENEKSLYLWDIFRSRWLRLRLTGVQFCGQWRRGPGFCDPRKPPPATPLCDSEGETEAPSDHSWRCMRQIIPNIRNQDSMWNILAFWQKYCHQRGCHCQIPFHSENQRLLRKLLASIKEKMNQSLQRRYLIPTLIICSGKWNWGKSVLMLGIWP